MGVSPVMWYVTAFLYGYIEQSEYLQCLLLLLVTTEKKNNFKVVSNKRNNITLRSNYRFIFFLILPVVFMQEFGVKL